MTKDKSDINIIAVTFSKETKQSCAWLRIYNVCHFQENSANDGLRIRGLLEVDEFRVQ